MVLPFIFLLKCSHNIVQVANGTTGHSYNIKDIILRVQNSKEN